MLILGVMVVAVVRIAGEAQGSGAGILLGTEEATPSQTIEKGSLK